MTPTVLTDWTNRPDDPAKPDAGAVRVKPLVWHNRVVDGYEVWDADIYDVWVGGDYHRVEGIGEDVRLYPTIEAAKAAAQADYQSRILAALEPDPDAVTVPRAVLEGIFERAEYWLGVSPPIYPPWAEQCREIVAALRAHLGPKP